MAKRAPWPVPALQHVSIQASMLTLLASCLLAEHKGMPALLNMPTINLGWRIAYRNL